VTDDVINIPRIVVLMTQVGLMAQWGQLVGDSGRLLTQ